MPQVAEIVTFRCNPDLTEAEVASAAAAIGPFLAAASGFVARHLCRAESGVWTDHVIWESHAEATSAGEKIMDEPSAQAFFSMIDQASMTMTHAPVAVAQRAA